MPSSISQSFGGSPARAPRVQPARVSRGTTKLGRSTICASTPLENRGDEEAGLPVANEQQSAVRKVDGIEAVEEARDRGSIELSPLVVGSAGRVEHPAAGTHEKLAVAARSPGTRAGQRLNDDVVVLGVRRIDARVHVVVAVPVGIARELADLLVVPIVIDEASVARTNHGGRFVDAAVEADRDRVRVVDGHDRVLVAVALRERPPKVDLPWIEVVEAARRTAGGSATGSPPLANPTVEDPTTILHRPAKQRRFFDVASPPLH